VTLNVRVAHIAAPHQQLLHPEGVEEVLLPLVILPVARCQREAHHKQNHPRRDSPEKGAAGRRRPHPAVAYKDTRSLASRKDSGPFFYNHQPSRHDQTVDL